MTNDASYGVNVVSTLLERHDLGSHWCFVDESGTHHGLTPQRLDEVFRTADIFLDFEWGAFFERAADIPVRVFIDGEPGWFHIKLAKSVEAGETVRDYDYFYTDGLNIGTPQSSAPTLGIEWRRLITPVLSVENESDSSDSGGLFTTVMNWQSNKPVSYRGKTYGQKDIEFEKFITLPSFVDEPIEVAVSGRHVPRERLREHGWHVRDADTLTTSVDAYRDYVCASKGEVSVAKNAFVETWSGWFGERPGFYLSCGKPVVLQDTGFSAHLPCGRGLFAVRDVEEAAEAIRAINTDYPLHAAAARELAREHLSSDAVIGELLAGVT